MLLCPCNSAGKNTGVGVYLKNYISQPSLQSKWPCDPALANEMERGAFGQGLQERPLEGGLAQLPHAALVLRLFFPPQWNRGSMWEVERSPGTMKKPWGWENCRPLTLTTLSLCISGNRHFLLCISWWEKNPYYWTGHTVSVSVKAECG